MTTPLHARQKGLRYLYIAKYKPKEIKIPVMGIKARKEVDAGWRYFWEKRGRNPPPYVSPNEIGIFE